MTGIGKAEKQMKKARPYRESQGYRFRRKADLPGGYSTEWTDCCFVNMNGRIQNYFPVRTESGRKRGKHAEKIL